MCVGLTLVMKVQLPSYMRPPPESTSHTQSVTREKCCPGPSEWTATGNILVEWIRALQKHPDPDNIFLAAKEGCQDVGSSAYENNVNYL